MNTRNAWAIVQMWILEVFMRHTTIGKIRGYHLFAPLRLLPCLCVYLYVYLCVCVYVYCLRCRPYHRTHCCEWLRWRHITLTCRFYSNTKHLSCDVTKFFQLKLQYKQIELKATGTNVFISNYREAFIFISHTAVSVEFKTTPFWRNRCKFGRCHN